MTFCLEPPELQSRTFISMKWQYTTLWRNYILVVFLENLYNISYPVMSCHWFDMLCFKALLIQPYSTHFMTHWEVWSNDFIDTWFPRDTSFSVHESFHDFACIHILFHPFPTSKWEQMICVEQRYTSPTPLEQRVCFSGAPLVVSGQAFLGAMAVADCFQKKTTGKWWEDPESQESKILQRQIQYW